MTAFLAVLKKDLRRHGLLMLAAAVACAAVLSIALFTKPPSTFHPTMVLFSSLNAVYCARWILVGITTVLVIQGDRAFHDRAAWHTRPIGGLALLTSKIVVLALGLIAPVAVLNAIAVAYLKTPVIDMARAIAGEAVVLLAVALFISVFAAFTRTLVQTLLALVATGICFSLATCALIDIDAVSVVATSETEVFATYEMPSGFGMVGVSSTSPDSPMAGLLLGIAAAAFTLGFLYSTRRLWAGAAVGVLALAAGVKAPDFFSKSDIVQPKARSDGAVSARAPRPGVIEAAELMPGRAVMFDLPLRFDGIPPDQSVTWASRDFQLIDPSGGEVKTFGWGSSQTNLALEAAVGLPVIADPAGMESTGKFSIKRVDFDRISGKSIRLDNWLTVTPHRFRVVKRLVLVTDHGVSDEGQRWRIIGHGRADGATWWVSLDCAKTAAMTSSPRNLSEARCALLNESKREVAISGQDFRRMSFTPGVIEIHTRTLAFRDGCRRLADGNPGVMDATWLEGATLLVLLAVPDVPIGVQWVEESVDIPTTFAGKKFPN